MSKEIIETGLPGSWIHAGTTQRGAKGDKRTSSYESKELGSVLNLTFGWSPRYHHCSISYVDSHSRNFFKSWGGNDEPGLDQDQLGFVGIGAMMGAEGMARHEYSRTSTKELLEYRDMGIGLFQKGGEWEYADIPISKVGVKQKSDFTMREPTPDEWILIRNWMESEFGYMRDEAVEMLQSYFITVMEGYHSDSPGYAGEIILCVWGFPSAHQVLIKQRDRNTGEVTGLTESIPEHLEKIESDGDEEWVDIDRC